jgi:TonB family protein
MRFLDPTGAAALSLATALACPGALAASWTQCNEPGLDPPVAVERAVPPYPESARLAGAEGFVDVAFTVLRDGHVGWVRIVRAEPSGFFEAEALHGVRDWRFVPAKRGGEPVECRIQTRVRFTLTDSVAARPAGTTVAGDQPAPVYPERARIEGLEGYVEVSFTIGRDGAVADAEVTLAMPRGEFEKAALAAVRAWSFEPDPEGTRTETRRFEFSLPDSYPRTPASSQLAAAPLPIEACTQRIAGRVKLEVDVGADGRITDARILESRPAGLFDATALAIARNSRLAPAWRGGVPIPATALLTLDFKPDEAHCPGGPGASPPAQPSTRPAAPTVSRLRLHDARVR